MKRFWNVSETFGATRVAVKLNCKDPVPGYHFMTQLHSNTELLRIILHILDEGCSYLDTYYSFPGKKFLEESTLYCSEILEHGLKTQHLYMSLLSAVTSSNKILTGLSRVYLKSRRYHEGLQILWAWNEQHIWIKKL